ncbi:hypothetical protein SAMN05414139_01473 [Burkholderia sp. D7]|nr:hypothetical protein SAMN05414139_01473 [Burkholderia sp. D7]
MPQRAVPELVADRLETWRRYARYWRIIHYCLGLTATVSSVLVAANKSFPDTWWVWTVPTFSLITALSTGILTFLNASGKSRAYIQAWRLVDDACTQFQFNQNYAEATLGAAMRRAEALIAKSDT